MPKKTNIEMSGLVFPGITFNDKTGADNFAKDTIA